VRIESSSVSLTAAHTAVVRRDHRETLRAWVGPARPDFEGAAAPGGTVAAGGPSLSARARQIIQASSAAAVAAARGALEQQSREARAAADDAIGGLDSREQMWVAVIEALLRRATGRDVKIRIARIEPPNAQAPAATTSGAAGGASPPRAGWGLEYDSRDTLDDSEATTVTATGEIRTADGARVQVTLRAAMTRQFHSEQSVSVRAGDGVRKDPLVLNFDGPAAALGAGRIAFDLDADGQAEQISTLAPGSGFLVLDADGNGAATDGRELFGPTTGDGFAELRRHDADGNGWIDAGDPVFSSLRVWRPTHDGAARLETLGDLGMGAIGLDRVASPFEFRDDANGTTGYATSTGLYVSEDGRAGTVQQIDLVT
jgi:hypothetical protein